MHTSFVHILSTVFCSWDTSKLHPSRSIEDIEACAATNEYSVKYPPLLSIDLDHVVPDELHLFLRIMDILIENLISYAVELDIRATRKQTDLLQGATLKKVQASIQSCGVSFQIWKKKEKPGELDWTSLGGAQKRKVLSLLPAQFPNILPPETCISRNERSKVRIIYSRFANHRIFPYTFPYQCMG